MVAPAPLKVPVWDSEGNLYLLRGYYDLTAVFIPNSWNCPDQIIAHSRNEEIETEVISWCGSDWTPLPELQEKNPDKLSAICLKCVKAYEEYHFGRSSRMS